MRAPLDIPIIIRRVELRGPAGIREIDMVLDTGAVFTVIAWDVAKDIGYDPAVSLQRTPIVTANGVIEAPLIRVDSMRLTELTVQNVEVLCHDIPEIIGIEGLLGLSFLRHFRTMIDFSTGMLEITSGG